MTRRQCLTWMLTLALIPADVHAQSTDQIIAPVEAFPAFIVAGETLTLTTSSEGQISLERNDIVTQLAVDWTSDTSRYHHGTATIPATTLPGLYSLRALMGNGTRANPDSVHILAERPSTLRLHFISTPGSLNITVRNRDETENTITVPTATQSPHGVFPKAISVGDYNLLFFDPSDDNERTLSKLHILRRKLKDSPWTIAIATKPLKNMPFRTQLILFEDDPIQALVVPKSSTNESAHLSLQTWNTAPIFSTDTPLNLLLQPTGITKENADQY